MTTLEIVLIVVIAFMVFLHLSLHLVAHGIQVSNGRLVNAFIVSHPQDNAVLNDAVQAATIKAIASLPYPLSDSQWSEYYGTLGSLLIEALNEYRARVRAELMKKEQSCVNRT